MQEGFFFYKQNIKTQINNVNKKKYAKKYIQCLISSLIFVFPTLMLQSIF